MRKILIIFVLLSSFQFTHAQNFDFRTEPIQSKSVDGIEVIKLGNNQIEFYDNIYSLKFIDNNSLSESSPITIYPNPARDNLNVDFFNSLSNPVLIRVINFSGQISAKYENIAEAGSYTLRIKGLSPGLYFVNISIAKTQYVSKVLVIEGSFSKPTVELELNSKAQPNIPELPIIKFVPGDSFLATAKLGKQVTRKRITPTFSQNIEFDFTPCIDFDGNVYPTVEIGSQLWMAANLKTTTFQNGEKIEQIKSNSKWKNTKNTGYCTYDNVENEQENGFLYNGYAVFDERRICPQGWRVPTDEDWATLLNALNNGDYSGEESQMLVNKHKWGRGNDIYGFAAKPEGMRYAHNGKFGHKNTHTRWWTSSKSDAISAWNRYINIDQNYLGRGKYSLNYGYSVRCIKKD